MKKIYLLTLFLALILAGCSDENSLDETSVMLYEFIGQFSKRMAKENEVYLSAIGGGVVDNGIWLMTVNFHRSGKPLTKEESREAILYYVEEILKEINTDPAMRPYLRDYPFCPQNINLGLISDSENDQPILPPYVQVVSAVKGKILYSMKEPGTQYGVQIEKESYEEALQAMKAKAQSR